MQSFDYRESWQGAIRLQLASDEQGRLSDVCVVDGNFGNPTEYVGCITEQLRKASGLCPMKRVTWTFNYVCD